MSQICNFCKEDINEIKFVSTDNATFYHINHFTCCDCGKFKLSKLFRFLTSIYRNESL